MATSKIILALEATEEIVSRLREGDIHSPEMAGKIFDEATRSRGLNGEEFEAGMEACIGSTDKTISKRAAEVKAVMDNWKWN